MAAGWNKGLTKETDKRVANYGKSVSEYYKRKRQNKIPNIEKRICPKCGKEFEIDTDKSTRKFCSKSCANSHKQSNETKEKISIALDIYFKENLKGKYRPKIIKINNQIKLNTKKFCSICGSEKGTCPRPDICKRYKVLKSLIKFGLDISKKGSLEIINEFDKVKKIIKSIYDTHPTDKDLKDNWNYNSGLANFHKLIKSIGIQPRNLSEAQKEAVLLGKNTLPEKSNIYKCGWHITWENKQVFLRSSYELDYAKELDKQKISYDVEKIRIKYFDSQLNKERIALPDFYLPETNTIVEIKSEWTLGIQNMKDKFKAYFELGYNTKLILNHKEVDLYSL